MILAFVWTAGLAAGAAACWSLGGHLDPLMRGVATAPVSIVGLSCVCTFPFLLSALAVFLSRPGLLLPVCFGRAFGLGFVSCGLELAFGGAGWLVRWLTMSAGCLSAPVLYGFWLAHIRGDRPLGLWSTTAALAGLMMAGSIDYFIITPFLRGLI